MIIYFATKAADWQQFKAPLTAALKAGNINGQLINQLSADQPASAVDYIIYAPTHDTPTPDTPNWHEFTKCKALFSLWAGVEKLIPKFDAANPPPFPIVRMAEDGMTQSMVEYVLGHVLRYHLGSDDYILKQPITGWPGTPPPLASARKIAVLGLGTLGLATAKALSAVGFAVKGWSRSQKADLAFPSYTGTAGLKRALTGAEIIITLLPATKETENIINTETLSYLAKGAFLINPGRGQLIDDDALLAALTEGQLAHATLDVFRAEPLLASDPFLFHKQITVTPHIAAATRPETAAISIIANIKRQQKKQPMTPLVDLKLGY